MWQKMLLSGSSGLSEITPILDFYSTSSVKSKSISTSGYRYLFVNCRKNNVNPHVLLNSELFSVSELSSSKTITIPKTKSGWSKDYTVTVTTTSISVDTDGVGIEVFGAN